MEVDYNKTKRYLNPSMLSQLSPQKSIQKSSIAPKRKFGGIIMQEDIPEEFKAEIIKRSIKPVTTAPVKATVAKTTTKTPVFKFQPTSLIKPGKEEVPVKSRSSSSSRSSSTSSSRSLPKVKRQKGGLRLPSAPKSEPKIKAPVKKSTKKAKAKAPVRRVSKKKQIVVPQQVVIMDPSQKMGQLYVMGEDVELPANDFRDEAVTFRVLNKLGQGGYGEVYQVFPISQDLPEYFPKLEDGSISYAMKVMIDPKGIRSFEFEHKLMDLIASNFQDQPGRCPNHVLCYFDISIGKDGKYYMLSEKMDGSISDYAENMKTTNSKVGLALKVFEQTLVGLTDLKKVGILHRDLKGDNLLYKIPTPNGRPKPSEIVIKIGDFGLSCVPGTKGDLACGKGFAGSIEYIDPKILIILHSGGAKNIDEIWSDKNDMYSLAVILYKIIFGVYLQDNDWYNNITKGKELGQLEVKPLREGYEAVYKRNVVNIQDLLKKYENSNAGNNRKIANMLRFMIKNLNPFDFDKRTNLEDTMMFYK